MIIKILKAARKDLKDGYHFYEFQQKGVGKYFLDSLSADIESLKIYAGVHKIFYGKYHRLLSKRFPFAIYYQVMDVTIKVYAVIDCRRDPAWIRQRFH